ncbi:MAG: conjugal transfer protein TraR [Deltaproteobacteria bacterium CG_4_10_14_0_2_um_filter_43_8]|nr:MAG: conjugal transfer protein TraR [Deltaproteobacteria bacterium CG11_big_fil_rev_8_21_14_0_20_42_23]PJA22407.1 MAG: conjugal transfer protein TraR [Deltaproteobacteria bacterium CG_4_10_14_0_2_um_filter_43_8]PJC64228.1 MAG: conjugal transfer protein TraR [Deltaproteobacteria bacterium CG_4_9_14_0_2_um_filter_42_21]
MKKKEKEMFETLLKERRAELVATATSAKDNRLVLEREDLPDEVDLASSEADQAMNMRLKDRELILLKKIDKALLKMQNDEYGICERCGEEIGVKRLEARPVAELCIRCKEETEKLERAFAD